MSDDAKQRLKDLTFAHSACIRALHELIDDQGLDEETANALKTGTMALSALLVEVGRIAADTTTNTYMTRHFSRIQSHSGHAELLKVAEICATEHAENLRAVLKKAGNS